MFGIVREWDADDGGRMIDVFAFSNASANFPHKVPNSDQNRTVAFEVKADGDHEMKILSEINQCLSREFQLDPVNDDSGVSQVLKVKIQTGRASEGHGF